MIRNYFKSAWRSLRKNKLYSVINVVGLALGLGVAITLFWIVRFELSFDRYHPNADRLYRLRSTDKFGEPQSHVPQGVIKTLREQFAGVEKAAPIYAMPAGSLKVGNQVFNQNNIFYAPPEMLEMLEISWIAGSPRQSLSAPGQVVIDEETAFKLFGSSALDGGAVGKRIRYDAGADLTVAGIIRRVPAQSEFPLQLIISWETLKQQQAQFKNDEYWGGGDSMNQGFVLLKPNASPEPIQKSLSALALRHKDESIIVRYELQPLSEMHFDTTKDPFAYSIPKWMLYTLGSIGAFLILIACINFVNLATVQAVQRSREIGVRKVLGSSRAQLVARFFGETALLVTAGIGAGSVLAGQLVRYADRLLNTQVVQSSVWTPETVFFLIGLGILVTLLAGFYPAMVLSGFEPVRVLRSRYFIPRSKGVGLRESLVVTQFVIAQILVICTLLGMRQIRYFYQKDLGFEKSAVVTVPMPDRGSSVLRERFRNQLIQYPEIKEITFGLTSPASHRNHWWGSALHPNLPNGEATFRVQHVDTNYFSFYRIPLLAGRALTQADTTVSEKSGRRVLDVVVNEKAVRDLGFRQPGDALGRQFEFWGNRATIIGVVRDYHSEDLRSKIMPHVFCYASWNFALAGIRIDPGRKAAALEQIGRHWKDLFPNHYFEPKFLEDDLRSFYDSEKKLANFLSLFAAVGVLIGCLGLFGLVSFVVTQRTKEIGLRKVLGASVSHVVGLLSKDFLKLVLIALLIASPIAWYAMDKWLQDFTYRIEIDAWVFALAGLLSVVTALLTVSVQSIRAALMNPVKSLRAD